jgi:hypothetical protein
MAQQYRVSYKDGRTQSATADTYKIEANFFVFYTNGVASPVVAADLVEHTAYEDAPEPTQPEIEVTEFRRAPRSGAV